MNFSCCAILGPCLNISFPLFLSKRKIINNWMWNLPFPNNYDMNSTTVLINICKSLEFWRKSILQPFKSTWLLNNNQSVITIFVMPIYARDRQTFESIVEFLWTFCLQRACSRLCVVFIKYAILWAQKNPIIDQIIRKVFFMKQSKLLTGN